MNTKTLALIFAISISYISSFAFAEEPFIGIGLVSHTFEQVSSGSENDFKTEPSSFKLTLGSRISKHLIIEAYYLHPYEDDEIIIGGDSDPSKFDVEYEAVIGASLNAALKSGFFTIYGGPNVTAAKITVESGEAALDAENDSDTRVSPGLGGGIDFQAIKNISINLHLQSYLIDGDRTGFGTGAELRYHF